MTFDLPTMVVAILFSLVGLGYFRYGKKQSLFWFMVSGLALMFYGYFIDSILWLAITGAVLAALPFFLE